MDSRLGTKTTLERQDDEADRHVRPAPKQKPPRQDLRRNQDHPDSDPDLSDESDRKDRSRNYKDVGGSVTENVVRRFLARRPGDRIPAKNRETGQTVMIAPSTLKKEPGKYTPLKNNEKDPKDDPASFRYPGPPGMDSPKPKEEPKPEPKPEPKDEPPTKNEGDFYYPGPPGSEDEKKPAPEAKPAEEAPADSKVKDEHYAKAGEALKSLAKDNPKLNSWLKAFSNPDAEMAGFIRENPTFPAAKIFHDVKMPDGIQTLGDIKEALGASQPKQKKPKKGDPAEAPKEEPKPEEAPKAEEAPSAEEAPEPEAVPEKPAEGQPEEPAAEKPTPEEAKPEPAPAETSAKPEAPKAKKPKTKSKPAENPEGAQEGAPEAKPEKTPAEKAGIALPQRREASHMEKREAASMLVNTFPPDVAANIMAAQLHPDDVRTLVRKYNAARQGLNIKDPSEFAAKMAGIYQTDPNQVSPPTKWKGQPFGKLNPEEQAEANRQHQLQVTALSLAAHEGLTKKLSSKGLLSGKPQVPPALASNLASVMLSPHSEGQAQMLADKTFNETLESGQTLKMSDGATKRLLASVKGSASATGVAKAFMQANDYQTARDKFLTSGNISEWDSPGNILKGLKDASRFFEKRNAVYGDDTATHPAGSLFRMRLMSRLKTLDPKRFNMVAAALPKLEESEYHRQMKAWGPKFQEWEKRKEAHESELEKYSQNPKSKPPGPFNDPEPVQPRKPVTLTEEEGDGEDMWKAALEPHEGAEEKPEAEEKPSPEDQAALDKATDDAWDKAEQKVKKASDSRGSTYPSHLVMGSASKTGVYHGIDPYAYGPASYPGWLQAHQRDLDEADFSIIEASAQDWLKSPILTTASEGMLPDARIRMALDLAIYNGPYNGAINPNNYDRLLTKLGGTSSITVRDDADTSSFRPASVARGENTMKASNQVRKFAAMAAEKDSKLAFEMLEFADRLAEDEEKGKGMPPWLKDKVEEKEDKGGDKEQKKEASDKFASLRSEVIKTAAAAADRTPFIPLLQTIKTLG